MLVEAKCSLEALNLSKETRYRGLQRSFLSTLQIFFSFISNMWYLNSAENTSESFLLRQFIASCTLLLLFFFFFTYYHNIGLLFSYFLFYFEFTNWILFFVSVFLLIFPWGKQVFLLRCWVCNHYSLWIPARLWHILV